MALDRPTLTAFLTTLRDGHGLPFTVGPDGVTARIHAPVMTVVAKIHDLYTCTYVGEGTFEFTLDDFGDGESLIRLHDDDTDTVLTPD